MKKYFFMAVAAMAALSSCTSDNELELNQNTGKEALTFTATMEGIDGTRATLATDEEGKNYAAWEVGDQISINGKAYSAQAAGTTSTFTADDEGADGETYNAYFPASLYNGTKATLPAIQTYTAGKFDMPMYASSTTTELKFYNLCAVLAIKVTSADIATLKSIKVASDQKMNGSFTVSDNTAVMGTDGSNVVVLESSEAITLTETGTTFYIAIPAQDYKYLNIFLSSDGTTYTQAMATKKADGLSIARSKIFSIDYAKNATKLWAGNLFIADCNVGAKTATEYGGYYTWGGIIDKDTNRTYNEGSDALTGETDTAYKLWGSNWRMPTSAELTTLKESGTWNSTDKGLQCTSTTYTSNSVFLPAAGSYGGGNVYCPNSLGYYWSSTPDGSDKAYYLLFNLNSQLVACDSRSGYGCSVRAVLEEAESPAPAAPATRGTAKANIGGVETGVNWIQLWENGPRFAENNVADQMSFEDAAKTGAEYVWGANWRTPSKEELNELLLADTSTGSEKVTCVYGQVGGTWGFTFTGKEEGYTDNSVFFPVDNGYEQYGSGKYWSGTEYNTGQGYAMNLLYDENSYTGSCSGKDKGDTYLVRPVLAK